MDPYEINKLDINRLYRYIDKMLIENDHLPINKKNNDEEEENMLYDYNINYNNYTMLEEDEMNDNGYIEN
jgi:hypothetical protein